MFSQFLSGFNKVCNQNEARKAQSGFLKFIWFNLQIPVFKVEKGNIKFWLYNWHMTFPLSPLYIIILRFLLDFFHSIPLYYFKLLEHNIMKNYVFFWAYIFIPCEFDRTLYTAMTGQVHQLHGCLKNITSTMP